MQINNKSRNIEKKLPKILNYLYYLFSKKNKLKLYRKLNFSSKLNLALKIHVSPQTKLELDKFGTFELELRGPVEMKVNKSVNI